MDERLRQAQAAGLGWRPKPSAKPQRGDAWRRLPDLFAADRPRPTAPAEPPAAGPTPAPAPGPRLASPAFDHFRSAIEDATVPRVAELMTSAYHALGVGHLTWEDVGELEAVATAIRARPKPAPERKPPRSPTPKGETSARRQGQQVASTKANLPVHVARGFADCARAVLGIIARECRKHGSCTLLMGEIAYEVGCTIESVRLGMRKAERRLLIKTVHRRRSARQNAPNLVTIADEEWRTWIAIGAKAAARRAGAELRTKAQAARDAFRRGKDRRAALKTLRVEAEERSRNQTPKGFGANPESFLQKESPSVASQPPEENCPNGSFFSGGGIFDAARRAAQKLGLDPTSFGIPSKVEETDQTGPILDGVVYHWT